MADFTKALAFVLQNEGGYSDDPGDSGGETYCGISRNSFPAWAGWPIVESEKADRDFPGCLSANAALNAHVAEFYRQNFWAPIRGDQIADQALATQLFDTCVNSGVGEGVKLLQRALRVTADGRFGPATAAALAAANPAIALRDLRAYRQWFYAKTYARDPARLEPFLYGWMLRSNK